MLKLFKHKIDFQLVRYANGCKMPTIAFHTNNPLCIQRLIKQARVSYPISEFVTWIRNPVRTLAKHAFKRQHDDCYEKVTPFSLASSHKTCFADLRIVYNHVYSYICSCSKCALHNIAMIYFMFYL